MKASLRINRLLCFTLAFTSAALLVPSRRLAAADTATTQPVDQAALEKQFAEMMTDATMVGKFTIKGNDNAHQDQYHLIKAVKADGDNWAITSRIEYRGFSLPITLTVPVKWAGDTPVIEVTKMNIPGFGVFTARVMFYNGEYVGTWSGSSTHAGMMFGKIEHGEPQTRPATQPSR